MIYFHGFKCQQSPVVTHSFIDQLGGVRDKLYPTVFRDHVNKIISLGSMSNLGCKPLTQINSNLTLGSTCPTTLFCLAVKALTTIDHLL